MLASAAMTSKEHLYFRRQSKQQKKSYFCLSNNYSPKGEKKWQNPTYQASSKVPGLL
jgi:hypothetical protein